MARVILDSGSALKSIGVGLLSRMSSSFGGAGLQIPLENGPRAARTATGRAWQHPLLHTSRLGCHLRLPRPSRRGPIRRARVAST